jgi:hypothetical protein
MDKGSDKLCGNKSHSVPPEQVIEEVILSIEIVEKKIEEFCEIHGTELRVTREKEGDFGRC